MALLNYPPYTCKTLKITHNFPKYLFVSPKYLYIWKVMKLNNKWRKMVLRISYLIYITPFVEKDILNQCVNHVLNIPKKYLAISKKICMVTFPRQPLPQVYPILLIFNLRFLQNKYIFQLSCTLYCKKYIVIQITF